MQQLHSAGENHTATGHIKYGNRDENKKYDLSDLRIKDNSYVIRHFNTVTLPSGMEIEDPGSSRFQVYEKETFDNLSKQKNKNGKQEPSAFEQMGLGVEVLHEPY